MSQPDNDDLPFCVECIRPMAAELGIDPEVFYAEVMEDEG